MTKYRSSGYGSASSPELPGCTYYKNKIGHTNMGPSGKNPDLLEGMQLTIDDISGISDIKIEMGANCTATYTLGNDLSSVVVSTTSASGIKPGYRNITLYYNTTSTNNGGGAPGAGLPSLLSAFGKTRLDECLTEGKDFLRITARDNARSDYDGVAFTPNTNILDYGSMGKFIKVDNTAPKLELTGLARNIA